MDHIVPTVDDVIEAGARLSDWLRETPVLESELLNERVGARVLVKAECLQPSGSFKIRGALNRILKLSHKERAAGVIAYSSGNHGAAVALAAHWLGIRATIVMPEDAPQIKKHNVSHFGAELVFYDRHHDDREQIATALAERRGAALVPPFEHADVVAGQGTIGLELVAAARERKVTLDAVYVPCGGGGLIAGTALGVADAFADCAFYAVEPEGYDDTARSLQNGTRQLNRNGPATLCDALLATSPGAISFAINKQLLRGALAVSDAEVLVAMALAAREFKLVVEPSGAAGLAAVLGDSKASSECIAVVLSGGNVDDATLMRALNRERS